MRAVCLLCVLEEARVYPSSGPSRLARRALLYLCVEKTHRLIWVRLLEAGLGSDAPPTRHTRVRG